MHLVPNPRIEEIWRSILKSENAEEDRFVSTMKSKVTLTKFVELNVERTLCVELMIWSESDVLY